MSVRKRTWKSKGEAKTAYVADYVDQGGKRHIKTFDRRKDADAFHAKATVEVQHGVHTASSQSVTVKEAGRLWLLTCERNNLERSTLRQYAQHLNLHIMPLIGAQRLSELSTPLIRDFEDRLRKPREDGTEGRSPALTRKILVSLGSLLADAQERGLTVRNPVREIRAKRSKGQERRSDRRQKGRLRVGTDIPTREEVRAIVDAAQGRWRPLLLVAIFCGLRGSELRGLRWVDVEFAKRELHVRQRADRFNDIGAPKSEAGERAVPLPPMLVTTLKEWKLACPHGSGDLVFPTAKGGVEHHKNIVRFGLDPAQITAGVTIAAIGPDGKHHVSAKYSLHSLRHFFASWCINRKADGGLELPAKVVQARMGHSSIMMTMDVYGHLFPRGDDTAELAAAERALLG